jgi:hypothetical protein
VAVAHQFPSVHSESTYETVRKIGTAEENIQSNDSAKMLNKGNKSQDAEDPPIKYKDDDKPSRVLRVLTVVVYLTMVSMVALLLSLYYIFLWSKTHTNDA